MTATMLNSFDMTQRWMRALMRQPWWIAITLVQPIIWLLLFGALFKAVTEIPGFESASYNDFLAPGVIVMASVFAAGWNGMGTLEDLQRGVMDRFLVTPVSRTPLILGPIAQVSIVIVIQSLIMVGISLAVGADFPGGIHGIAALFLATVLLAAAIAAGSQAIALVTRQEETLIGIVQFVVLPLTFLSACFMQLDLAPQWIQDLAKFNPVNWTVEAGRDATSATADWGFILERIGLLAILAALAIWVATRAFRSYQRSV
jgi:ABC-2 type transport system permease protein